MSFLLLEEAFDTGDPGFLPTLEACREASRLAGFAPRWRKDPRPWARTQLETYLARPLAQPLHEGLLKRLFKDAEAAGDHRVMALFLVACDKLIRRRLRVRTRVDWRSGARWKEERLHAPSDTLDKTADAREEQPDGRLFSYRTRHYLRRRCWRYFRRLGFQRPEEYPAAIAGALRRYTDDDLAAGENILDSWGLLQACYRESKLLDFGVSYPRLRPGQRLAALVAAPRFPELWGKPASAELLWQLALEARAHLVRRWAVQLLEQAHAAALRTVGAERIRACFACTDPTLHDFGARLLEGAEDLSGLEVAQWLALLQCETPLALEGVVRAMRKHLTAARLTPETCVELTCAQPTPVARLGLDFLREHNIPATLLARLAEARCEAAGEAIGAFALAGLDRAGYDGDRALAFLDSPLASLRRAALAWLAESEEAAADARLFARLFESPHDDVRFTLVRALERGRVPGAGPEQRAGLWRTVLLGIHRGGRAKLSALRSISAALRAAPERGTELLPVLAVAVRSVRLPEARAGIAAVVAALTARPALAPLIAEHLPELELVGG